MSSRSISSAEPHPLVGLALAVFVAAGASACSDTPVEDSEDTGADVTDAADVSADADTDAGDAATDTADVAADTDDATADTAPDTQPDAADDTGAPPPGCGDGVVDDGEECDDGNTLSADGCSTACTDEALPTETEPNDDREDARNAADGSAVIGVLPDGDVDCYRVSVPDAGYLRVNVSNGLGGCWGDTWLRILRPDGSTLGTDDNDGPGACSAVGPQEDSWARFMDGGTYYACVEGFFGRPVPGYVFEVETGDTCRDFVYTPPPSDDHDLDLVSDRCDVDDDNDGVPDTEDNCPLVSNGPNTPEYRPDEDGFIRDWLVVGGGRLDDDLNSCFPTDRDPLGGIADAAPEAGDDAEDVIWWQHHDGDRLVDLNALISGVGSSEAYAFVYVDAPEEMEVEMRLGSDDGARAWLNGELVVEADVCRGADSDGTIVDVTLREGVNRVMLKIRNSGGGWGYRLRFWDVESDLPVRDLVVTLSQLPPEETSQLDTDGDRIGDACDPD